MKTLLASQEHLFPDLFLSIHKAMKPLFLGDLDFVSTTSGGNGKFKSSGKYKWTKEKALTGDLPLPQSRSIQPDQNDNNKKVLISNTSSVVNDKGESSSMHQSKPITTLIDDDERNFYLKQIEDLKKQVAKLEKMIDNNEL